MVKKTFVIGIAGISGCGKTFFLNSFLNHLAKDQITLLSQDDYYIPSNTKTEEENKLYNFDIPTAIDRDQFFKDIKQLMNGISIEKKKYNFNNKDAKKEILTINPSPVLIIEGLFIYQFSEINDLIDYKVFIEAVEHVALRRRLKRDLVERMYCQENVMYKWTNHVLPCFQAYLLPYRNTCDIVIENNEDDPQVIQRYVSEIISKLNLHGLDVQKDV